MYYNHLLIFIIPIAAIAIGLIVICMARWWRSGRNMDYLYAASEAGEGDVENQRTEEDIRSNIMTRILTGSPLRGSSSSHHRRTMDKKVSAIPDGSGTPKSNKDILEVSLSGLSVTSCLADSNHNNVCPICIDVFKVGDEVASSPRSECPHTFHASCITSWLISPKSQGCCPMCRHNFLLDSDENKSPDIKDC